MEKNLTDHSQKLIELLLTEPKIAEAVFMDVENREAYKILDINQDGTLTLGKRSIRWWNRLFNLEDYQFQRLCIQRISCAGRYG